MPLQTYMTFCPLWDTKDFVRNGGQLGPVLSEYQHTCDMKPSKRYIIIVNWMDYTVPLTRLVYHWKSARTQALWIQMLRSSIWFLQLLGQQHTILRRICPLRVKTYGARLRCAITGLSLSLHWPPGRKTSLKPDSSAIGCLRWVSAHQISSA